MSGPGSTDAPWWVVSAQCPAGNRQARHLLESDAVATVVTLQPDGSPHISAAWVGLEHGEIVIGTLDDQQKLRNLRRGSRIAISVFSNQINMGPT
jgi:hypothetical protein